MVVLFSLTGTCKTVSARKRGQIVVTGEEGLICSSSDLNGFKLLWDCMLRIWFRTLNCSVKPHLLTDILSTVKKHQKSANMCVHSFFMINLFVLEFCAF